MKGWLEKYTDGGDIDLNISEDVSPQPYKYLRGQLDPFGKSYSMSGGYGNDKGSIHASGFLGMPQDGYTPWNLGLNADYNVNNRLNLFGGANINNNPSYNVGLKYKFPDGGPIEVPYTNKEEYEQAQQMYSDSLLVNQMRGGRITFSRPDYLGAMDRLVEANSQYPEGQSPKTIPVYMPPDLKPISEAKPEPEPEVPQGIPTYYTDTEGNRKFIGYNTFRQGGALSKLANSTYNNWLDKL